MKFKFRKEDRPVFLIQIINIIVCGLIIAFCTGWKILISLSVSAAALTALRLFRLTRTGEFLAGIFAHLYEETPAAGKNTNSTSEAGSGNTSESTSAAASRIAAESDEATEHSKLYLQQHVLIPSVGKILDRGKAPGRPENRKIRFRIINRDEKNAFVFCRKEICITGKLLEENPECVPAVLMHEFGHIQDDSTRLEEWNAAGEILISFLNRLPVLTAIYAGIRFLGDRSAANLQHCIIPAAGSLLITLLLGFWYRLRKPFLLRFKERCEQEADRFAVRAGFGEELKRAVIALNSEPSMGEIPGAFGQNGAGGRNIAETQEIDDNFPMYYNKLRQRLAQIDRFMKEENL